MPFGTRRRLRPAFQFIDPKINKALPSVANPDEPLPTKQDKASIKALDVKERPGKKNVEQSGQSAPSLKANSNAPQQEAIKLAGIAAQGLENTSQREEERPSRRAAIEPIIQDDKVERVSRPVKVETPKPSAPIKAPKGFVAKKMKEEQSGEETPGSKKVDKITIQKPNPELKSLPMENAAGVEFSNPKPSAASVENSKPKGSVLPQQVAPLKAIAKNVRKNIKKADAKIKKLSAKGMREQIQKEIALKEKQLAKLKTLLDKCPQC